MLEVVSAGTRAGQNGRDGTKALQPAARRLLILVEGMAAITAGGTERQILQMVRIARNNGLVPELAILRETRWLTEEMAGCPVTFFDIKKLSSVQGLGEMRRLLRWMRRGRFHILQTFFSDANLIGPVLARLAGISVVVTTRRNLNPVPMNNSRATPVLRWLANRLTDHVLANSQAVVERVIEMERVPRERLAVVYNGVDIEQLRAPHGAGLDLRHRLGLGSGDLLIGNVSGLRKVKGIDMFVEAALLAHQRDRKLRFMVVGDGEERSSIEQLIAAHGLQGVITLAGAQVDIRPYLAAMDIAVLCSSAEGFSNSILEYMAFGLPVIATDVGGNREALRNAGLLIPPNAPRALADAICELRDTQRRDELSYAALKEVHRFDLATAEKAMGRHYAAYCEMVDRKLGA